MNQSLSDEIDRKIHKHSTWAPINHFTAELISWLSIVISVLAALSITNEWFSLSVRSIIAALPALLWTLMRTFRYEDRADWHYKYKVELQGLKRNLREKIKNEQDVSINLNKLEIRMHGALPRRRLPYSLENQNSSNDLS